jgi:NAD(P)-dependent dehydrogenase (short-subunit alcohol dehydrogenase family)
LPATSSKGGLVSLARPAALEVAGQGLRVNDVNPTIARAEMTEPSFAADPFGGPAKHLLASQRPIGRTAEPEEVAEAALFSLKTPTPKRRGGDYV